MRMKTLELSVGLFMLMGFSSLAVLALQVSGLSWAPEKGSYTLYASFENIGGLTERSKVTVAGVTVGRVVNITLNKETFSGVVEMAINADYDNFTADTTAAILTAGLLGEKYIGLISGADEELLEDGAMIEDTQSALVLEDLIGQFLFNKVNE
ncbi:MAG: outer membrane lipid asymmetry maintenance protein MlaD [Pseudomonadales bacterium]|jgi:phospholipid/cholesterol/gamma-HCH transport system substrate-binding protein